MRLVYRPSCTRSGQSRGTAPACAARAFGGRARRGRRAGGAAGAALIEVQKGYSAKRERHTAQVR